SNSFRHKNAPFRVVESFFYFSVYFEGSISLFIMFSGLIFTIERLRATVYWGALINTGAYPSNPNFLPFLENIFIIPFFLIGIGLMYFAFRKDH
ncbi:hypothetical protein, partial [Jeotgalibacillus sp. R-1-5s-1]|uniref:hypothetical protein n=1 Tax=Jeotgalibacillus sp. R-1-5s-1 TaxID=2555897 RepID=UPI001ABCE3C9